MTELVALVDGEGSFATLREVFGVNDDTPWQVSFYAFLAHVGDATVLVDTGLGPSGLDPVLPEWQGRLPQALAAAGAAPEQVDLVVLTHLHVDHVGWNMRDGVPFFPNARYVAHRAEEDPITSAEWRQRLLADFASSCGLVGFGHLGLGRVVRERDGFGWRLAE